jgi:hypothetical protein
MEMQTWRGGWDRAADATEALKGALQGMSATDVQGVRLRPMVSGRGTPWVDVGMIPASLAQQVAVVIRAGSANLCGRGT